MRQGQGIIDLMNTSATAMFYGFVGLFPFIGIFLIGAWQGFRRVRKEARADLDFSLLGANLVACIAGMLTMMATGAFGQAACVRAALLAAYLCVGRTQIAPLNAGISTAKPGKHAGITAQ